MKHARHVIAMTLVATAICADRSLPAARIEPVTSHFAGRLIERLSVNFRRVVPAVRLYQHQRFGFASPELAVARPQVRGAGPIVSLSPFQFRLPPPAA
jgi:hypothetical protein